MRLPVFTAALALLSAPALAHNHEAVDHSAMHHAPAAVSRDGESKPDPAAAAGTQIGGAFTLVNEKGETVTDKNFLGQYMLVFFGFTFCPDICPTELQDAINAIRLAGSDAEAKVRPVLITVDPERDTPEKLADYVKMFGDTHLTALTGSAEQIAAVAKAYKVYYAKTGEDEDYMMDHSSFLYLMDDKGVFRKAYPAGTTIDEIAASLKEELTK